MLQQLADVRSDVRHPQRLRTVGVAVLVVVAFEQLVDRPVVRPCSIDSETVPEGDEWFHVHDLRLVVEETVECEHVGVWTHVEEDGTDGANLQEHGSAVSVMSLASVLWMI